MDEWTALVQRSWSALEQRQAETFASVPPGLHWHYDIDEPEPALEFVEDGSVIRRFRIVVVGTTSEAEGTWLWSWANESMPPAAIRGMEKVRQFGEAHGFDGLTVAEWPAEQAAVVDVVSVAGELLGAAGYFRSIGSDVAAYLLLDPA